MSGEARILIDHHRPNSYLYAKQLLNKSFSSIHLDQRTLFDKLQSIKLKPDEKIHQYIIRLKECATAIANKIECNISGLVIFEPLSQTFLSNFEPFLSIQSEVISAINLRDFDGLTDSVLKLLDINPNLLLNQSKLKICANEQIDESCHVQTQNSVRQCIHCRKNGHDEEHCWTKHPQLRPKRQISKNLQFRNNSNQDFRLA